MNNPIKINKSLIKNAEFLSIKFEDVAEFVEKDFLLGETKCKLYFVKGICDLEYLAENILRYSSENANRFKNITNQKILSLIPTIEAYELDDFHKVLDELTRGESIVFVEGIATAFCFPSNKYKERNLAEPPTSAVVKGPRAGFVENLKTNLSSLRHIIPSCDFKSEMFYVGKYTKTQVCVCYINSIANIKIVNEVKTRLKKIEIDGILDSYYIAEFLSYKKNSMFKQIGSSEKPDVVSSKILEGRIAIIVDNSPIVLTVPFLLIEDLQTGDDYYDVSIRSSYLRIIRLISLFLTIFSPGIYISILLHHYKAFPLKFLINIINTTEGLPLTPFAEILLILLLFEILFEASLRMPQHTGLALSIVGALILGDTAVKAGLISPPGVMIVAVSGLTLYTIPEQASQLSILRLLFTLIGGFYGIYGIVTLSLFFITYLCDFDSYGASYLAPLSPLVKSDLKDAIFKKSLIHLNTRPESFKQKNKTRQK